MLNLALCSSAVFLLGVRSKLYKSDVYLMNITQIFRTKLAVIWLIYRPPDISMLIKYFLVPSEHHHLIRYSQLALSSSSTLLVNLKYLLHVTAKF